MYLLEKAANNTHGKYTAKDMAKLRLQCWRGWGGERGPPPLMLFIDVRLQSLVDISWNNAGVKIKRNMQMYKTYIKIWYIIMLWCIAIWIPSWTHSIFNSSSKLIISECPHFPKCKLRSREEENYHHWDWHGE